jgi:hypothetical protein
VLISLRYVMSILKYYWRFNANLMYIVWYFLYQINGRYSTPKMESMVHLLAHLALIKNGKLSQNIIRVCVRALMWGTWRRYHFKSMTELRGNTCKIFYQKCRGHDEKWMNDFRKCKHCIGIPGQSVSIVHYKEAVPRRPASTTFFYLCP